MHEIPVELENTDGVRKTIAIFRVTFRPSDDASDALSEDAVEVLDVRRFDVVAFGVSEDDTMIFPDDATRFSELDELTVIHRVRSEKLRQHEDIIIVPVRANLETVRECRQGDSSLELSEHRSARLLRPFADGERREEV